MATKHVNKPARHHVSELRQLIPLLPRRQRDALRRSLIDLLTDVSSEKRSREKDAINHLQSGECDFSLDDKV